MDEGLRAIYDELYGIIAARSGEYARCVEAQCAVWEGRSPGEQPLLFSTELPKTATTGSWPTFTTREIHFDRDKMLITGMIGMASAALGGMQSVPSIRANMGCSIFPSLFPGVLPQLFDDDRMPWITEHLDKETIKKLRPRDIKLTDEFKLGLDHMAYMAEMLEGTGAYVYPMDLQDAVDIAHLVYGDDFFYDLYDDPDFINHLLDLSCRAVEIGITECLRIIPHADTVVTHYNQLAMPRSGGGIKFSEDTSTLLSPEHIEAYTIPSLKRQLEFSGGGYVHFCGHNTHLFDAILELDAVRGLNFGNPEKYDMEEVLRRLAKAGKVYYGTIPQQADETYEAYFSRLLISATDSTGCCRLLLSMSDPGGKAGGKANGKADDIKAAWKRAYPTLHNFLNAKVV
jgi:hypothetical protein